MDASANAITFQGIGLSSFVFSPTQQNPVIIDGQIVVTFYLSPTNHVNPIVTLYQPDM